ncbi:hypothetical protein Tco_0470124, partial [Tanacetum coccineum]
YPDLELAKKMSMDEHQEKREGGGTDADMEKAIKLSLDPSFLPQGQPPIGGVAIRDPVSETIPKLPEVVGKGKAKVIEEQATHFLVDIVGNPLSLHFNKINKKIRKNVERESRERKLERNIELDD